MSIVITITLSILILCVLVYGFILFNEKYYCKYFETEDWCKWEDILSKVNNIHLSTIFEVSEDYWFNIDDYPNYRIHLDKTIDGYTSFVSDKDNNGECILCDFDTYHSNKLVKELFKILEREKNNSNIEHIPF